MVYLLHCERPLHHAGHYLGFTDRDDVDARVKQHQAGNGAKLTRAFVANGIPFSVVRTWPEGDRLLERQLKRRHNNSSLCPICVAKRKAAKHTEAL